MDGLPVTVTLYPCKAASQVPLLNVPPVPFQRIKDALAASTLIVCVFPGATGLVYVIAPQVGAAGAVTFTVIQNDRGNGFPLEVVAVDCNIM